MRTLPKSRDGYFAWADAHAERFAEHAAAIGLTAQDVARYVETLQEARAAALAQEQAMLAARSATLAASIAEARSREQAALVLAAVRLHASRTDDTSVYQLAGIAPPRQASPLPPPGTPYRVQAALTLEGGLALTWEADNPAGSVHVTYNVLRQVEGESGFTLLATVGERRYVDDRVPRGIAQVSYAIESQRGRVRGGRSFPAPISLGTTGPGRASMRSLAA